MPSFGSGLFGRGLFGGPVRYDIVIEIDVTNEPTDPTRVWTEVQAYADINRVRAASWTRDGRSRETERTQPGSLTSLVLDNTDGVFDRLNSAGDFYGPLDWAFWIRVSLDIAGTRYVRWTGVKNKIEGRRPGYGKDRLVEISGDSPLTILNLAPLGGQVFDVQTPGPRVSSVLAAAPGIVAGSIDPGKDSCILPAIAYEEIDTTSAFSHLQNVEQDERGLLFSQADGTIDFQDRYYRADLLIAGPLAVVGEDVGDIRYVEGDTIDDSSFLFDEVAVTPGGDSPVIQIAEVSAAFDTAFPRRLDMQMLCENDAEALSNAQWYAERFGQPNAYLPQLEIVGANGATWETVLNARNSDLFQWEGAGRTVYASLERVSESFTPGQPLKVLWDMSPQAATDHPDAPGWKETLWKLGTAGQSELGTTTRVG